MDSEVRRAASEGQKYDTFVSVRRPAAEQRWVKAAAAAVWICVGLVATALCLNWAVPREQQEHVADSKSYLVDTHECQVRHTPHTCSTRVAVRWSGTCPPATTRRLSWQ